MSQGQPCDWMTARETLWWNLVELRRDFFLPELVGTWSHRPPRGKAELRDTEHQSPNAVTDAPESSCLSSALIQRILLFKETCVRWFLSHITEGHGAF